MVTQARRRRFLRRRSPAQEFLYFVHNANGQNPVEAVNSVSGAFVGPAELGPDFAPALAGDLVTIFASGLGPTNPNNARAFLVIAAP